jgi:hypothetical protein
MATKDDVINIARNYLRDFPRFFQTSFTPNGITYELGKPNIDAASMWVAYVPTAAASVSVIPSSGYTIDERNGLLRLKAMLTGADTLMIEGYHYEWLTTGDMSFFADMAIDLTTYSLETPLETLAPAVVDVIGINALVQALWALLSEYSRDIDVITSESVHIIASQRYRMVSSLLDYWQEEYDRRAQALNIGLERLEVFTLRRVSKTTNRLVPLYKSKEVDDIDPLERLFPPIDDGVTELEEQQDDLRSDVFVDGEPPPGNTISALPYGP